MKLPIKMTLVRTKAGVVLISPVPKVEDFKTELGSLGVVTDIVAPNLFHHLGIRGAAKLYPEAKIWGAKGFKEKRPNIHWFCEIPSKDWCLDDELLVIPIQGMPKVNEVVLLHRPSKTLIVSDFCFNHIHGSGFGNWLVFHLFGTYRRFAVSKLFLKMINDKDLFAYSVQNLLREDFENIVVPHGEDIVSGGKELLKKALEERNIAMV